MKYFDTIPIWLKFHIMNHNSYCQPVLKLMEAHGHGLNHGCDHSTIACLGACFKLASGEFITAICDDQLYRVLGTRKTMKQLIKKIILFSSLHFASAIISISKCCPLGEALDQLGACRKVQVDHFVEEVNHWTVIVNLRLLFYQALCGVNINMYSCSIFGFFSSWCIDKVALLVPSSERVEEKLVKTRCKEVADEFMARVSWLDWLQI